MKLGIIARAEDRGLGIQSWEACRHLSPERVLVVDVQNGEGFDLHLDRYPGATVARLDPHGMNGGLNEHLVREWLAGLDVVLSMETLYDWRLADWARDAGCVTVVQLNPEFFQHGHVDLPAPDVWWNPSTWRMDLLPSSVRHVPVPVALDRFCAGRGHDPELAATCPCQDGDSCHWRGDDGWPIPRHEGPLRALHVVGRPALRDRNGTELLAQAMRAIRPGKVELTVSTQGEHSAIRGATTRGAVENYWDLYDGFDVLVMPRRFGGLCLPVQEAMAAGLAVVMPDCPPNGEMWPVVPVRWRYRGEVPVPAGPMQLVLTDPLELAAVLSRLADDPVELAYARGQAAGWAETHSWAALLPLYEAELARAADSQRRRV